MASQLLTGKGLRQGPILYSLFPPLLVLELSS